jgi:ssDNA-binding replication factor A large subunit
MMHVKVAVIKAGMRNMEVIGRLIEIGEPVQISTRYGMAMLARAKLKDETGEIVVNLWRQQIDAAKPGEIVILKNAFAREFGNVIELNIGVDGEIAPYTKNTNTKHYL